MQNNPWELWKRGAGRSLRVIGGGWEQTVKTKEVKRKNMVEVVQRRGVGYQDEGSIPPMGATWNNNTLGSDSRAIGGQILHILTHIHTHTTTFA